MEQSVEIIDIILPLEDSENQELWKKRAAKKLKVELREIVEVRLQKHSIDARKAAIKVQLRIEVGLNQKLPEFVRPVVNLPHLSANAPVVVIVGSGPAGMFAALRCIERGKKPIVLERGKDASTRRFDLGPIMREGTVIEDSNYCFGEGGAGTYSDGKLYTRATKRGPVRKVYEILVAHGGGDEVLGDAVILATGHSARDIYKLLAKKDILLEQKPFAVGMRIEHPQPLIDSIQYSYDRGTERPRILPAAGMSLARRDSPFANSGMVVTVEPEDTDDFQKEHGVLAGIAFQKDLEIKASIAGGGLQKAPGQRVVDFIKGRVSDSLPKTSYFPGLTSCRIDEILPDCISKRMTIGLKQFSRKMSGYIGEEANFLGFETRTSSPVRIPRDEKTLHHPEVQQLIPCGEGAGYAGGIVSAALDGMKCADY